MYACMWHAMLFSIKIIVIFKKISFFLKGICEMWY